LPLLRGMVIEVVGFHQLLQLLCDRDECVDITPGGASPTATTTRLGGADPSNRPLILNRVEGKIDEDALIHFNKLTILGAAT
jgi:hypothetical protein